MVRIGPLALVTTITRRLGVIPPSGEEVPKVPTSTLLARPAVLVRRAEVVVRPSTLRVREGVVRVGDGLEFRRRGFATRFVGGVLGDAVGVGLEGTLLVGGFYLVGGGGGGDAWGGGEKTSVQLRGKVGKVHVVHLRASRLHSPLGDVSAVSATSRRLHTLWNRLCRSFLAIAPAPTPPPSLPRSFAPPRVLRLTARIASLAVPPLRSSQNARRRRVGKDEEGGKVAWWKGEKCTEDGVVVGEALRHDWEGGWSAVQRWR